MDRYLYVAQGRDGLIKVGITTSMLNRQQQLRREFGRRGDELIRMEQCGFGPNAAGAENGTVALLSRGGATCIHGREWFRGASFDEASRIAAEKFQQFGHIRHRKLTPEEIAALDEHWRRIRADRAQCRAERKAREAFRRQVRDFRSTVCARIAAVVTGQPAAKAA